MRDIYIGVEDVKCERKENDAKNESHEEKSQKSGSAGVGSGEDRRELSTVAVQAIYHDSCLANMCQLRMPYLGQKLSDGEEMERSYQSSIHPPERR